MQLKVLNLLLSVAAASDWCCTQPGQNTIEFEIAKSSSAVGHCCYHLWLLIELSDCIVMRDAPASAVLRYTTEYAV